MELAADEGMTVERRRVPLNEVGDFAEIAACGTAVVMTAIKEVVARGTVHSVNGGADTVGPVCQRLYERVRGIQNGDAPD
eukprot:11538-Heterococcus_DN1.PRE.1